MGNKPFVSIITASNRPFLWKETYNNIHNGIGDLKFECIFIGPEAPDFNLPKNLRYIKTGNIKPPQCNEIGMRESNGDMIMIQPDDVKYFDNSGVSCLYDTYLELCNKRGNNKVVVLPSFKDGTRRSSLKYIKQFETSPVASLNSALVRRELMEQIGGIDTRFIGVYWDCDLAMRLNAIGVYLEKCRGVCSIETTPEQTPYRLHKVCKKHDRWILDGFWTRFTEENEKVPSEDTYCYMKNPKWVLTKKRQKVVIPFVDEDILTKSQGIKKYGELEWE